MPYLRVWIHLVWGTKNRYPYFSKPIKPKVIQHICEYAKQKGIEIAEINGHTEHIHCLISLASDQTIATLVNLLKGESSFWINKNKLTNVKFGWADEYFAASVSQSRLEAVRRYIRNQEKHHQKKSYMDEYEEFITKYGFVRIE